MCPYLVYIILLSCPNIYGRFKISLTGTISYPDAAEMDTLEANKQGLMSLTRSDKTSAVQGRA